MIPPGVDEVAWRLGYLQGLEDGQNQAISFMESRGMFGSRNPMMMPGRTMSQAPAEKPKRKGRVSAYNRRLGKAIKELSARHKLKSGKWKKGWSQKRMMQAAHKAAKR